MESIFLILKPKKMKKTFFELEDNTFFKKSTIEHDPLDCDLDKYKAIIDLYPEKDSEMLQIIPKKNKARFNKDITYSNAENKYINFDYETLFIQSDYLDEETAKDKRIDERQEDILDFLSKFYNAIVKEINTERTEEDKMLKKGIALNEFIEVNTKKKFVLIGDNAKKIVKEGVEYVTPGELTVIREVHLELLKKIRG